MFRSVLMVLWIASQVLGAPPMRPRPIVQTAKAGQQATIRAYLVAGPALRQTTAVYNNTLKMWVANFPGQQGVTYLQQLSNGQWVIGIGTPGGIRWGNAVVIQAVPFEGYRGIAGFGIVPPNVQ